MQFLEISKIARFSHLQILNFATPSNGVVANSVAPVAIDATLFGVVILRTISQGSSFLATLGWRPQSLWDSAIRTSMGVQIMRCAQALLAESSLPPEVWWSFAY